MAHILWQQRCLEVASRLHHVGVVDETRRTYRHHGRQRDAPRRLERSATRRCASHHIATQRLSRWGSPAARAFSADGPPQAPVAPRRSCERNTRADEFACCFDVESPPLSDGKLVMNKDDEHRRNAAKAQQGPTAARTRRPRGLAATRPRLARAHSQ